MPVGYGSETFGSGGHGLPANAGADAEGDDAGPNDRHVSGVLSVGVEGSAQVSKEVILGQMVDDESALPLNVQQSDS